MMLVLYPVSPGPLASLSFYRFIAWLSFHRYRYRYTELVSARYFLSYRFQTIIPKLPVRYPPQTFISSVFSTPFSLFSCPLFWLSLYSFCSNHTIHIRSTNGSPWSYAFRRWKWYPSDNFSIWPYRRGGGSAISSLVVFTKKDISIACIDAWRSWTKLRE